MGGLAGEGMGALPARKVVRCEFVSHSKENLKQGVNVSSTWI